MHSTGLRPLVAALLQRHGYAVHEDETLEGRSGATYTVPLLAEGDRMVLVEFKESPDPVEPEDRAYLARLIDDAGAPHVVMVHAGSAPHAATPNSNITFWGPNRLRTLLGDVQVHDATGAPLAALPFGVQDAEPAPTPRPEPAVDFDLDGLLPSPFQDATPEPEPTMGGGFGIDLDALESIDAPVPTPPAPTPETLGASALKPRIPIEEARAMVTDRISRIEGETLVLHPVHLVDYECDLMVDGSLKQDTVSGRIQVGGGKSGSLDVDPLQVDVATVGTLAWTGHVDEKPFRRDADRALAEAKEHVMNAHTKMVDVQADDDDADFSVMERKKVAPDGDQIRLQHRAATFRPAWKFVGPNGTVTLDALTGDTLDESLQTRRGDTIILD